MGIGRKRKKWKISQSLLGKIGKNKRRKMRKKKRIFLLKYEKDIIREKANNINLTEKKKNNTITKRSFSTNSEKRKKENNPFVNSYSLLYKNKKEYPI